MAREHEQCQGGKSDGEMQGFLRRTIEGRNSCFDDERIDPVKQHRAERQTALHHQWTVRNPAEVFLGDSDESAFSATMAATPRLQTKREPHDVIVIDAISWPTPN